MIIIKAALLLTSAALLLGLVIWRVKMVQEVFNRDSYKHPIDYVKNIFSLIYSVVLLLIMVKSSFLIIEIAFSSNYLG